MVGMTFQFSKELISGSWGLGVSSDRKSQKGASSGKDTLWIPKTSLHDYVYLDA